jgi:hypothetical protein
MKKTAKNDTRVHFLFGMISLSFGVLTEVLQNHTARKRQNARDILEGLQAINKVMCNIATSGHLGRPISPLSHPARCYGAFILLVFIIEY